MGSAVVKHAYTNPVADVPGDHVTPSRWNANHTVESVTVEAADITDATAAGRTVLKAADAPAQRTALGLGTAATANANAFEIAGAAIAEVAAFAATLGSAAFQAASAFDAAGAAAAVAAALAALDASLAQIAKTGNAAHLSGTLDPARIADGTLPIGKLAAADVTAFAKTILDDGDAATVRGTLGLGVFATGTDAANLTGNLAAARIPDGSLPLTKLADQVQATIDGRAVGAGSGPPVALTPAQARAVIASDSGDNTKFIDGTGAFSTPVAAVADGDKGDVTITGGVWTIDNGVVTHAKQANIATQRAVGRNTAGSGAREEVTISQMLDWASNTNGAFLARQGGTWSAPAKVTIDADGDLNIATNATPTAPGAGKVKPFALDIAGRPMLSFLTASNIADPFQPFFGSRNIARMTAIAGGTTPSADGMTVSPTGTATARNMATTNLATQLRRVGYVSNATAGQVSGLRVGAGTSFVCFRGNAAGQGGFHFATRWLISDAVLVTDARTLVGLRASVAPPTDVESSSLTNIIGFGHDAADTTLHLIHNDGAGTATKVNLGANFPINTTSTDIYEVHLYCAPNAASVGYHVFRLNTGNVASGTISTDLPAATQLLSIVHSRSNNATAAAVGLDVSGMYLETP